LILVLSADFSCVSAIELRADLHSCRLRVSADDYCHPVQDIGAICN
jgi:hypothetical protein